MLTVLRTIYIVTMLIPRLVILAAIVHFAIEPGLAHGIGGAIYALPFVLWFGLDLVQFLRVECFHLPPFRWLPGAWIYDLPFDIKFTGVIGFWVLVGVV